MPKDIGFEIEETGVLLGDAANHHCRWIIRHHGRGAFIVCGRQVRAGSAYCEHHHTIVWRRANEGGRAQRSVDKPEP